MKNTPNRRQFLKTTAVAGAGVLIARDMLANESPNEKIAFAAVGVGGKGDSDSHDAANAGEMVAICDTNRSVLEHGKSRFQNAKPYEDYRVMFDEMGDKIDAFTVSTTDHMHGIIAAHGMKRGKHCFCQKPLTRTIYEARRLGEIARENNVATQMGNQGSADNGMRCDAAMLRAGVLGHVKEVYLWTDRPIWPQGHERGAPRDVPGHLNWDCWLGVAPKRPYSDNYDPFAWRGWWDFGTGALGDIACHSANLAFSAFDLKNPTWVQATTSGHNGDSFPSWSVVEFFFPANDWRPEMKFIWMDGGKRPDAVFFDGREPDSGGFLFVGEKGKFHPYAGYVGMPHEEVQTYRDKAEYPRSPGHFEEFAEAIKTGEWQKCWSNFRDHAGPLTEMVLAGNLAVWGASEPEKQGPRVDWDGVNMKITNDPEGKAAMEALVTPTFQNGYERF